jgi:hypothetical protein
MDTPLDLHVLAHCGLHVRVHVRLLVLVLLFSLALMTVWHSTSQHLGITRRKVAMKGGAGRHWGWGEWGMVVA